jgi:hypothetical protein
MRRFLGSALVLAAVMSVSLSADLKVTSKMSVRAVPGAAPATDMMSQMMGPMMLQLFGGTAGVEMVQTLNADGRTRIEYRSAFAGMPAGAVIITRADGTSVGFDAKAGTWWKMPSLADMPAEQAAILAQMKPEVTTRKTGQFETVAGFKAEKVTLSMRMPIPLPPEAAQLPAEFLAMMPREFIFEGDSWVTPQFDKYMKALMKTAMAGPLAQFGFDKLMTDLGGFAVKQVMRMNLLAGYEMETVVISAVEEAVPASAFDVPAGLKEVPMPTPGIGGE